MQPPQIPFWIAVVININIVIGSAFFLGAPRIAALGGVLAPLAWLFCGLLLLPLVLVLARLAQEYPTAGGIYVYSKERLGDIWGFLSGWGYFIGTVAGNAAVIHAFSHQLHQSANISTWLVAWNISDSWVDALLVVVFTLFNLLNVAFFERLQITFTVIKSIPFLLLLVAAPAVCSIPPMSSVSYDIGGLLSGIPFVLFAYIGIEACCAIIDQIKGGHRAGSRAILTSFFIIVSVYTLFQAILVCSGDSSVNAFFNILPRLTSNQYLIAWGNNIVFCSILASFLAGFYGMFYYNNWNLYAMAQERSIPGSSYISIKNQQGVPWVCVLIQSLLVMAAVFALQTSHALVTVGDFGVLLAYALCVFSALRVRASFISIAALVSCGVLIYICAQGLWQDGVLAYVPFIVVMFAGVLLYALARLLNLHRSPSR